MTLHTGKDGANMPRREFMKAGAAAAGLLGATSLTPALGQTTSAVQQSAAEDLPSPAGLHKGAELDCRFPVSFKDSVPVSLDLMSQYFTALSERNLAGMRDLMHFPFATYEGPECLLVETPDQLMSAPPLSMNVTGKGDSKIKPGGYDILDNIELHIYGPVGAGISMQYSRFGPGGDKLLEVHGIYGITNNDGKWGIEWASTIFKPANQALRDNWYNFPIADYAMHESHRDHVMARRYGFLPELRETVFDPYPHATVSISGLHVKGVKSRLHFSKGDTREYIDQQTYGQNTFAQRSGVGVGTWALSIETPDTRTLYSSAEKGHFYCGYFRYTQDGSVISEHRYLCALTNWKGRWYGNDISRVITHITYQDRTNDIKL